LANLPAVSLQQKGESWKRCDTAGATWASNIFKNNKYSLTQLEPDERLFMIITTSQNLLTLDSISVEVISNMAAIKKCIEWRLQVQIAFSMEVYLAPGQPE
jgi:hypothetical protein